MMKFIFEEEDADDEEFIDLSSLPEAKEKPKNTRVLNPKGRRVPKRTTLSPKRQISKRATQKSEKKKKDLGFSFEEEVPPPKTIADPEVRQRAQEGRKRSINSMSYENKRAEGWSLYCSHMKHLPTLCEKGQLDGEVTCTCSCHEARGLVRPKSESVSGSDDEEYILLFD